MGEREQHTPGQLRVTADADAWSATHDALGTSCYCSIRDADGTVVALAVAEAPDYSDPDCRSIATRIVRCVNAHDGLVEAIRLALRNIQPDLPAARVLANALLKVAAISNATAPGGSNG